MAENTKIEWVDHTANPWQGCSKVPGHPGCDNCYAERMSHRNPTVLGIWGDDGTRVPSKSFAANLRRWNKQAAERGVIETVFPSLCDPFEDRPELVPLRQEMFASIDECPNLSLILLTKRPENVARLWCSHVNTDGRQPSKLYRPNIQLLTSISDQATADKMVPELLKLRDLVPILGLSIEPLLGPINLDVALTIGDKFIDKHFGWLDLLDWIIVGGESGPRARPMHPDWVRSLRDQAIHYRVPFFFKQWGEWWPCEQERFMRGCDVPNINLASEWLRGKMGEHEFARIGKAAAGRLLDGRTWDEFPNRV